LTKFEKGVKIKYAAKQKIFREFHFSKGFGGCFVDPRSVSSGACLFADGERIFKKRGSGGVAGDKKER
jgi:hypothetical protein